MQALLYIQEDNDSPLNPGTCYRYSMEIVH